jgi:hypothetical protein
MDFTMEKPAFTQNSLLLHAEKHVFPQFNPQIYFPRIIRGKSNFLHEYLSKIRYIYIKLFLDNHQEPFRCCLMTKKET